MNDLASNWVVLPNKDFPEIEKDQLVFAWNCMEYVSEIEFGGCIYVRKHAAVVPPKYADYLSVQIFEKKGYVNPLR